MRIAIATAERVRRAVDDLDYRPNLAARSLRTTESGTLGVLIDHLESGSSAGGILAGASRAARDAERLLLVGESAGDPVLERRLLQNMLDRQVDGIAYVRRHTSVVISPDLLHDHRVVLVNCFDKDSPHPSVLPDEYTRGRLTAEVLIQREVADEVYVVGNCQSSQPWTKLQLAGMEECLDDAGFALASVLSCASDRDSAFQSVRRLLRAGVRPGALVCLDDTIVTGACQALECFGLEVPWDVQVISFDGSTPTTSLRVRVTLGALPYDEMGARAIEQLTGPTMSAQITWVPSRLSAE